MNMRTIAVPGRLTALPTPTREALPRAPDATDPAFYVHRDEGEGEGPDRPWFADYDEVE